MLAVQAERGRLSLVALIGRAIAGAGIVALFAATLAMALSHPCQHRQRIWTAGFSLGDQCLR